jgi:hypothetical protein
LKEFAMKFNRIRSKILILAAAAALPLLAGCATYGYATYGPPADEVEVYGVAPSPDYVWVGGHHVWASNTYTWHKGEWQRPPRRGAHWQKGTWEQTGHGWRYHDGSWR